MRPLSRSTLVASIVTLVLALDASTGAAMVISLIGETFRAAWPSMRFETDQGSVTCAVTLEGSFSASSFTVAERQRIGSVTSATAAECSGGSVTLLREALPWSLQYSSFGGTLPDISTLTLRVVGAAMQIQPTGGVACLGRSTETGPAILVAERETYGAITGMTAEPAASVPLTHQGCHCAAVDLSGSADAALEAATTEAGEENYNRIGIFFELLGTVLTAEGQARLVSVDVRRDELARAELRMRINGWRVDVVSISLIAPNRERFVLAEGVTSPCSETRTYRRGEFCRIGIRTTRGTPEGVSSNVKIAYLLRDRDEPISVLLEQLFTVNSVP